MITVKIGEFRNRLSTYLRKVRQGNEIIIADREHPIGRIIPYSEVEEKWEMIEPSKGYEGLASLTFKPISSKVNAVEELLAERRKR